MAYARSARMRPDRRRCGRLLPPYLGRAVAMAWLAGCCLPACMTLGQPVEPGKPTEVKPPIPDQEPPPKPPEDPTKPKPGAEPPTVPPEEPEKLQFPISKLDISYNTEHPGLPKIEELLAAAMLTVARVDGGFMLPDEGREAMTVSVADLNAGLAGEPVRKFSRQALREVLVALVREFNRRGLIGVIVEVHQDDLETIKEDGREVWNDLRTEDGRTELRMQIYAAVVTEVRSVAAGDRIKENKVNNPAHTRVARNSPVQPENAEDPERRDLLRKDLLDDYVLRLNRVPGRRIDIAITGGAQPGEVTLDYLVRESNPLLLYAQISNTGTKETSEWRERLGLQYVQVADRDDVFSLDYVTASFTSSHIVNGSYEFPIGDLDRLRSRLYASYSQFNASEVGMAGENFHGRSWIIGGEMIWNAAQYREVFLDLVLGLRYQNVFIENQTVAVSGQTGFFLPGFGVRLERNTEEAVTSIALGFEGNIAAVATDQTQLNALGRLATDESWYSFNWNAEQSFFLEPIFDGDNYRLGKSTLAHEMALSFRGQAAFNHRVVPNFEQVAGGLYSVRGYPESVAAGDTVLIGSVEYRLHIPRLLPLREEPGELFGQTFRWAPQQAYARPDWDLIFRAFVDAARTINNRALPFEHDETLLGAGVGLELVYRRNLSVRVDWGMVLDSVTGKAERGDNRFHIVATLMF